MKTNLFATAVITLLLFASCTEAFRHKMKVADHYVDDMNATGVTCGASTNTTNGVTVTKTTLTFAGCDNKIEDIEREYAANRVAKDFYGEMTEEDLAGETHLEIIAETKDKITFTYVFELEDLKEVEEYLATTDKVVNACIEDDQAAIGKLKDDEMMPDEAMYQIYNVTHYNDSLFAGQQLKTEVIGYRFAEGAEDPDLQLFSVDYGVTGDNAITYYTINIDRETKKVVYIWLRTDPL
jgi:hypothetical protein